jgi:hypothetical protein
MASVMTESETQTAKNGRDVICTSCGRLSKLYEKFMQGMDVHACACVRQDTYLADGITSWRELNASEKAQLRWEQQ